MPLPFDATLKDLVHNHPADWLAILEEPFSEPIRLLTPDLSTVSAFADIVLGIGERILHIDFQSGADAHLSRRLLMYNTLLYHQYGLPVHSIVVLLHPRAARSDLTGMVSYEGRSGAEVYRSASRSSAYERCRSMSYCKVAWGRCRWLAWGKCPREQTRKR